MLHLYKHVTHETRISGWMWMELTGLKMAWLTNESRRRDVAFQYNVYTCAIDLISWKETS